ncbi:superoxide dismutase [cu-zn], putative [Acanthamoeba castellanii str. Neff]|uniref:Superoxide dismutase [cu-zn], putative n=1 Tax=Acanthamoeba castellanii (strain ATCC 30010 / Neff) TaxID=1257118 RepID=L8HHC8_ACACF|nr:superoxide dismutase [cu-zn], putative [Acanthamoeba castellanii str. Neff]ELR24078.1 superoxide dismutase [cu-zn], putative [Acanthamoeba castellanii str. Neff]
MSSAAALLTISVALLALLTFSNAQPFRAQCVFTPTTDYGKALNIRGHLSFYAATLGDITGNLGTAEYAISINDFGDMTNMKTGESAGSRFIGAGSSSHGCPPSPERRAGDLGNWPAKDGVIDASQNVSLVELVDEQYSIVGLSAVLYAKPDNCSDPTIPDSNRLAVCVIGIANSDNNPSLNANPSLASAVAVLQPTTNCDASCSGTVWILATSQVKSSPLPPALRLCCESHILNSDLGVQVVASVAGLKAGAKHGFHIHQYGDLSLNDGTSAGAHWNPNGRNHELPGTNPRHVGDLGNIQSFDAHTGLGWYNFTDANIPNVYSLLGRSVVVHADVDHGSGAGCDQAGTAGKRLLIGVIGVANTATLPPAQVPITVDNKYENLPCVTSPSPAPKPPTEDNSGLKTGLAIGWVLVGVLALVVIPGMIAYYWLKIRPGAGGGEFYRSV